MTESDLAVHLSRQTRAGDRGSAVHVVRSTDAVRSRAPRRGSRAALVLDALTDEHVVLTVGAAVCGCRCRAPVFAIGSGGLSHGIARAPVAGRRRAALPDVDRRRRARCSPCRAAARAQTRRQAEAAAARPAGVALPCRSATDAPVDAAIARRCVAALAAGRSVVLTSDDADAGGGGERPVLEAIAERPPHRRRRGRRAPGSTRRVIVCGGDTSSRVARLLGIRVALDRREPGGQRRAAARRLARGRARRAGAAAQGRAGRRRRPLRADQTIGDSTRFTTEIPRARPERGSGAREPSRPRAPPHASGHGDRTCHASARAALR